MNLLTILLQALTAEQIQQRQDSIRANARHMVELAKEDPHGFLHMTIESLVTFGIKVLAALAIFFVGMMLLRWVRALLKRRFERRKTEPTIASFIISFVNISVVILLTIVSVSTLGVDTTSLAALLAAGAVSSFIDFAGGLMILAFKPFKAGDFIEAQGTMGKVVEVNITATKILTPDNRVVILPNGALSNGVIHNYNGRPLRRVEWSVSVSYGVYAAACKAAILAILNSDPRVLQADTDMKKLYDELKISAYQLSTVNYRMEAIPAPFVALKSLNSNDITFVVRVWVRSDDYWSVFFDLQERFYTELPPQGFTFAYPHLDVTMVKE